VKVPERNEFREPDVTGGLKAALRGYASAMARLETTRAVCEIALEHQKKTPGGPTGHLQASGYFEESAPPTEWDYVAYIREHPELIEAWYEMMGDQRCIPGWVLSKPGENGNASWEVSRYPDIAAMPYPDGSSACGALVARYTASLIETIRDWEEREKNKGRKRRKSRPQEPTRIELQNSDPTVVFKPNF
jgi:hypothetical protein